MALSVALAIVAAYAALDLAGRVTAARNGTRAFWLAGGSTAMGLGVWAMHYIGMLAFRLQIPVRYHYPTVILSLLAAIAASGVALITVSRKRMGPGSHVLGSLAMGGGIAAMHYIGMAAMRMPAMMSYRWDRVALSVSLGIAVSLIALILSFQIRQGEAGVKRMQRRKLASALLMGSAIPLMHYTGMWAVQFRACDTAFSTRWTLPAAHQLGIVVISVVSFVTMILAIVAAFLSRVMAMQIAMTNAAKVRETNFRMLVDAMPQVVWTAEPSGQVDYANRRLYELTGVEPEHAVGNGWHALLHPDDLPVAQKAWTAALESGTTYETECRLHAVAGSYRWHLVRATPLRDASGKIKKWFGCAADIDGQMRHQQVLEEQLKEHTAALMDANDRLQTEMQDRALAQQELNQQNEIMVRELTRRSKRATLLAKMAELLQSCASLKDVFGVVAGLAPKMFPEWRGAVLLTNSSRKMLEVAVTWAGCELPSTVFEPQDCWALRTGHLHSVAAGDSTAQCAHASPGKYSYLCLPLLSQGEAVGILHFQITDDIEPPEGEKSMASTFADQVGLSVANLRLRDALRSQSIRDPLSGLYNRRYLEEMMERETRRAVRAEHGLGVLMLDLDHFKNFNDTYGHDAGDTVLREVAAFLVKSVRAEDIVCRFGGEEFVVILPMADLKATEARAQRICTKLRETTVLHRGQSVGAITVSIGIASLPDHGTSPRALLDCADAALYRAKREGRDRVVVGEAAADVPSTDVASSEVKGAVAGNGA